jgi:hypothetical protein
MNATVSCHDGRVKKVEVDNYSLNVRRKFLYHFSRKVSLGRDILGDCSVHKMIILKLFVKKYRFTGFIWLAVGRTLIKP